MECKPHHWIIETATAPTSRGVCKKCGERRVFNNFFGSPKDTGFVPDSLTVKMKRPRKGKRINIGNTI